MHQKLTAAAVVNEPKSSHDVGKGETIKIGGPAETPAGGDKKGCC